jgi:hypothetical protein
MIVRMTIVAAVDQPGVIVSLSCGTHRNLLSVMRNRKVSQISR